MHSQVKIVCDYKFQVNVFINIDKESNIELFKSKIKQDLPTCNQSTNENKQLCRDFIDQNSSYKNIIYDVYKDDFDFFKELLV